VGLVRVSEIEERECESLFLAVSLGGWGSRIVCGNAGLVVIWPKTYKKKADIFLEKFYLRS